MLEINNVQNYSYDEARCGYGDSREVMNDGIVSGYDIAMTELLQARKNQMLRNSGVAARGFSWADDFSNVHSANFAGMNTSSVIATGSWSSPRKDFATIVGDDGHAVTGFDFIDVIPTDGVFLDGVRNGYALIEDHNLGSVNNQVNDAAKAGRPYEGHNAAGKAATEPILNIQSSYQNQNNAGTDGAGFGSEDFGIAHVAILSQREDFNV